jgi:hypothetical protein
MIDPILEITNHLSIEQLVAKANDEIRALCLGPNQKGGRRWTICVPVQVDDSDIVIAAAIRRLQAALEDEHERSYANGEALGRQIAKLTQERDEAERHRWYVSGVSWRQQAQANHAKAEAAEARAVAAENALAARGA